MKRRDFLGAVGGAAAVLWRHGGTAARGRRAADTVSPSRASVPPRLGASLLVPMDQEQTNHLKAYGLAYDAVKRGGHTEWLLNYRGGSFLIPDDGIARRAATLAGIAVAGVSDADVLDIRGTIEQANMDAVPLEKAPRVAIYSPPFAPPWDDAVTLALRYADIPFTRVWDPEVLGGRLADFDWLHLHHEDFTGQYSKFYLSYAGASWLADMVQENQAAARTLGFANVPALKKAVARRIRASVEGGGFLFAMCTATETLELALAAHDVDIAAEFADGTPMDGDADAKLDWTQALACKDAHLERNPAIPAFSDIDGHQVNNPALRQPLGAFELFNFSAKIDPVPTMLVQCHRQVIPDFYGITTSFTRRTLKAADVILAEEPGAPWVKYIHGDLGRGTWTYLGGHDPEDPQHQVGNPPTDLSLHPTSPGYRLILNNVLFPAARKRELKT
ncbi:MAG: asparagine synthetase B [Gemmatimonadales bacterium]